METTVRLISCTAHPLETLWCVWKASREDGELPDPFQVERDRLINPKFDAEVRSLFQELLEASIPVIENVSFTFLLENVSISLREQLVRHRIGVKVGERLGVDMVPDLADSTWWSQSMRILDMGQFAAAGKYCRPATIDDRKVQVFAAERGMEQCTAREAYDDLMAVAARMYQRLVEAGVPMEDARNVLPLATTHRLTWTLNLGALRHITGKRGCWILQLGLWKPVVMGMVNELAERVDPAFRELLCPPCFSKGCFTGCKYALDNRRRVWGDDEIPPCPLWSELQTADAIAAENTCIEAGRHPVWSQRPDGPGLCCADPMKEARRLRMAEEYARLWGRNPFTGQPTTPAKGV